MFSVEDYLTTIIVNRDVNYRQLFFITKIRAESPTKIYKNQRTSFVWVGRMRRAHWQPKTKEGVNRYINPINYTL